MAPVLLVDAGSLATSCMHTHKSDPITVLPRRVPRPRNCHPSALEVILSRPQEPQPPPRFTPGSPPTRVPPFYALLTTVTLRVPHLTARTRARVAAPPRSDVLFAPHTVALRVLQRNARAR